MAYQHAIADHQGSHADPMIRRIGTPDVFDTSAKGVADLNERPSLRVFLVLLFAPAALTLGVVSFPRPFDRGVGAGEAVAWRTTVPVTDAPHP